MDEQPVAPDLSTLDADQLAAIKARSKWLHEASERARKRGHATVKQIPPDSDWDTLIWRSGRGFGKTISLTEFLWWEGWRCPGIIGHYVAPTLSDVKKVIFEGPVGLCQVIPAECLLGGTLEKAYNKTDHVLTLSNGSKFFGFSATEQAGRLRGPQCHVLACDELREWDKPAGNLEQSFTTAMLGCRLVYPDGTPSRAVCGTTPANIPFLRRLYKRPHTILVTGSSYENIENLAPNFRNYLATLAGTKLGKTEVMGEDTDEEDNLSIFRRSWFKLFPSRNKDGSPRKLPTFNFILESYDTAYEEQNYSLKKQEADYTACVVFGIFNIADSFSETERRELGLRGRYGVLICDVWQQRLGFPDLLEKARAQHRIKWGSPGRRADIVLIEDKGSGISLRQVMREWNIPTWKFNPGRQSKSVRGNAMAPVVKNGCVFVPESIAEGREGLPRDWCEDFLEQVCAFIVEGSVEHDDMYDAFVQGLHYLQERDMIRAEPPQLFLDYEERIEHEQKQAEKSYARHAAQRIGNPYGE